MTNLEVQAEDQFKTMQFSQKFIKAVMKKTREKLEESRSKAAGLKQGALNQKTALEVKRNKLEDALIDGTIDRETFKRKHTELQDKILNLEDQLQAVDNQCRIDVNLIEEVLAFTRNIYQTYKDAPPFLKRHYLRFFFEKLLVKNKEIIETIPTPVFLTLRANHLVIIRKTQLRGEDSNLEP